MTPPHVIQTRPSPTHWLEPYPLRSGRLAAWQAERLAAWRWVMNQPAGTWDLGTVISFVDARTGEEYQIVPPPIERAPSWLPW